MGTHLFHGGARPWLLSCPFLGPKESHNPSQKKKSGTPTHPSSPPTPYLVCKAIGQGQIFLRVCCKNVRCGVGPRDSEDAIGVEDERVCGRSGRKQCWALSRQPGRGKGQPSPPSLPQKSPVPREGRLDRALQETGKDAWLRCEEPPFQFSDETLPASFQSTEAGEPVHGDSPSSRTWLCSFRGQLDFLVFP